LFSFFGFVLICIPLAFYFQHASQFWKSGGENDNGTSSEILFMLYCPFSSKVRFKMTMLVAMLAWGIQLPTTFTYSDTGDWQFFY
jgi:hypothetical protein